MKILTIGYEGSDTADFIATLKLSGVDLLLDVREFPISRKKGFSKTALGNLLNAENISYQHEKLLGSPKAIRHQLRKDKDYKKFFSEFEGYIETQKELLKKLSIDINGTVALMCYEEDYNICHRKVVADKIGKLKGIKPKHIGVKKGVSVQYQKNKSLDLGQGLSSTQ